MKELVYGSSEYNELKTEALALYGVIPTEEFDPKSAIRDRIDYLKFKVKETGMNGYTLGVSGGVDSTTASKLAQLAVEELRLEGYVAQFIADRLPAGVQADEKDAQAALNFINPDKIITINVGDASKDLSIQGVEEIKKFNDISLTPYKIDFALGNMKARLRMASQYQIAGLYNLLVLGTDHSTEGVCGFWTKWADGSCDSLVLNKLNKTQVRLVAKELGAPEFLWNKPATADLEELTPQKTDEDALGIKHDLIDAFLEGKDIDKEVEYKIIRQFYITQHKRKSIAEFEKVPDITKKLKV